MQDFAPTPNCSSSFASFNEASSQLRCFLVAKVHENNGIADGKPLNIVLEDMAGSLRCTFVWPPMSEVAGLWDKGNVIMRFGPLVRREC